MKKIYNSIKFTLFIALVTVTQSGFAQCTISYNQNGENIVTNPSFLWGQGFIAECDGKLEYVQLTSNSTGTVSAGTLNIYNGNDVSGTPIYTQSHPSITITQVNDPIRIDVTGDVPLVNTNQYTFEFTVDNVNVLADLSNGYADGTAFQNGTNVTGVDFIFEVSILSTLSIDSDFDLNKEIKLLPNPSSDFITITNIETIKPYRILNALGQEVHTGRITSNEKINIRNFTNGVYFLKFDNGHTLKFIKK